MNNILLVLKASQEKPHLLTPKSVKNLTTTTSHYSHLPVTLTPTSARQWPTFKSDTKWSVIESEANQFEGRNNDYNDYEMKKLNDKCVSDWKDEKHKY